MIELHYTIFKSGPETWNKWRKHHPDIKPDLSGLVFDNKNKEMSGYDFTMTDFTGAKITCCFLSFNNFQHADLVNVVFIDSHFRYSNFRFSKIMNAELAFNDFFFCDFYKTTISNTTFRYSRFYCTCLVDVDGQNDFSDVTSFYTDTTKEGK